MKKQNDDKTNSSIDVNETKSPKKKRLKVSTIVIIVLVMMLLFSCIGNIAGSGSSSSSTSSSIKTTEDKELEEKKEEAEVEDPEEEQEPEPEVEDAEEEQQAEPIEEENNDYIHVGDTIGYSNGSMYVADAGIVYNMTNQPILFVEVEADNTSDGVLTIGNDDFSLYIDDYQVDVAIGYRSLEEMSSHSIVEINPGRKAKYVFRAVLPSDYDNASKIEVEFPDRANKPLLIKDNGVYLYGRKDVVMEEDTSDTEEGGLYESWYEEEHHNMDGLDYTLIFNHTVGGADAEVILRADYDHQWLLWMEDERNGYLTYMEGNDKVGSIYFGSDGIEFKNDDFPELDGYYW